MTLHRSYTVKIERDDAGYYAARCVELPAAMTQGKTEEEAIENIKEAIRLVLNATSNVPKETVSKLTVSQLQLAYA